MEELLQNIRSELAVFDWNLWRIQLAANALRVALVVGLALLTSSILVHSIRVALERVKRAKADLDGAKQVETIRRVLTLVVRAVIWTVAAISILSILGVSIAPLLTAAGVTGIAAGFAAQSLVKDYFSGFALLLEGQLRVGDIVEVGGYSGVVEGITLRTVRLRDYSGQVIFVPCGSVTTVVNKSMGFAQSVIDVGVAYREDPDTALAVMRRVAQEMASESPWCERILDAPEVVGVEAFQDSAVLLRLRMKVLPGSQWDVRREYLRRLKKAFDHAGIEIPFPHLTLYPGVPKQGHAPSLYVTLTNEPLLRHAAEAGAQGAGRSATGPLPQE